MQMTSFLVATNHLFYYSGLLLPIENRQQRDEHSRYEVNAVVVVVVIVIAQTAATEDQLLYIRVVKGIEFLGAHLTVGELFDVDSKNRCTFA